MIRKHVRARRGDQGWTDDQMIMALVLLNLTGGSCIEDIRVLEGDEGFCRPLRGATIPSWEREEGCFARWIRADTRLEGRNAALRGMSQAQEESSLKNVPEPGVCIRFNKRWHVVLFSGSRAGLEPLVWWPLRGTPSIRLGRPWFG